MLAFLGSALVIVGIIASLVFSIMILVKAFQTSIGWGIGSLLLAFPIMLIFVFTHWAETKKPFLYMVLSWVVIGLGVGLGFAGAATSMPTQ